MNNSMSTHIAQPAQLSERCAVCNCILHRSGGYASGTFESRSHATRHHLVAERFFGRSANRPGDLRTGIFAACPWQSERVTAVLCYECHEELLHNPVFLPADLSAFAALVRERNLHEDTKPQSRDKISERIKLLHDVISAGLQALTPHVK